MLRDVRSNVTDGLLGFATATGDGLHIKIGVSPSVTEKPITILGSMGASTIKSKLGLSPLADAVMDAVQGGAAVCSASPSPRAPLARSVRSRRRATAAAA